MEPTNTEIKKDTQELVKESHDNPSNSELFLELQKTNSAFVAHVHEDKDVAEKQAIVNEANRAINEANKKSLASMHERLKNIPDEEKTAEIVEKVIQSFIKNTGKKSYAGLLILAGIVGALAIIGGGAKALLGWIGFTMIGK